MSIKKGTGNAHTLLTRALSEPGSVFFQNFPGAHPQVVVAVPVLPLGTPHLQGHHGRRSLGILISAQALLDESPGTINYLSAGFSFNFAAIRELVGGNLDIVWLQPDPLATSFHPLLLVNHRIVQHARDLHAVGPGRVRVQHDATALKIFVCKGLPVNLPHGSRSWSTRNGDSWIQFHEHQGLRAPALDQSAPLLPDGVFARVLVCIRQFHWSQGFLVEGCFVNLDISPGTGSTSENDSLLGFDDMGLS